MKALAESLSLPGPLNAAHDPLRNVALFAAQLEEAREEDREAIGQMIDNGSGLPATLDPAAFGTAVLDRQGQIIGANERFPVWLESVDLYSAHLECLARDRPVFACLPHRRRDRYLVAVGLPAFAALNWPLWPLNRDAIAACEGGSVFIVLRPSAGAWQRVRDAVGLTPAESHLLSALASQGDLQRAAAERKIAHETARKFVASASRKLGSRRQAELIHNALPLSAGKVADPPPPP